MATSRKSPTLLNQILGRKPKGVATRRRRTMRRKQVAAKKIRATGTPSKDNIDVRTPGDIPKLKSILGKNKIVMILVYADWCGHCGTFKENIWSKLASMPNRKLPMVQVNEQVLPETPLANNKIDGYPTVMLMGQDGKAAEFKDDITGQPTVSMPNTRDLTAMGELVKKDPNAVLQENGFGATAPAAATEERSIIPTESAKEELENDADDILTGNVSPTLVPETSVTPNPPSVEDDIISSQEMAPNASSAAAPVAPVAIGGGALYASLLAAAQRVAPTAALTGAAMYLRKKRKSRHGTHKKRRVIRRISRRSAQPKLKYLLRGGQV